MRLICLCLFLATPVIAETDIRQLVIEAAAKSDCALTMEQMRATFPPLGLTESQVGEVVARMRQAGEAQVAGEELRLSPKVCKGGKSAPELPEVSKMMARVIKVFRQHGCMMEEATGRAALQAAGITDRDIDRIQDELAALVKAGLITRIEGAAATRVEEPLCSNAKVGG